MKGMRGLRSGSTASRRTCPALCRVCRYGLGLPIEAMKRKRVGVLRGVAVAIAVEVRWVHGRRDIGRANSDFFLCVVEDAGR